MTPHKRIQVIAAFIAELLVGTMIVSGITKVGFWEAALVVVLIRVASGILLVIYKRLF